MLKKRKFFWWGIVLLLLIGAARGYYLFNKPRKSAGDMAASLAISADSLYTGYQRDEQGFDKKYLGKVIEVSGRVSAIQQSGQSEIWILATSSPTGGGVNCQLFPGEHASGPQPKPGDEVTIKGKCTGFLIDVNLADCAIGK